MKNKALAAMILTLCCAPALMSPVSARDSLTTCSTSPVAARSDENPFGNRTINLRSRAILASDLVAFLSNASKRTGRGSGAWDLEGIELLDDIVVSVRFDNVPVEQAVYEVLGCLGFDYVQEAGLVKIVKSEEELPENYCSNVTRLSF